jgi:hypothetical protein
MTNKCTDRPDLRCAMCSKKFEPEALRGKESNVCHTRRRSKQ